MNRFAGIIITVVAIAALIGAALGWRFPFPGQNRTANQLRTSPQTTQQANRTQLRTSQPTNSARGTNQTQTTAQVPNNTQTNTQPSDVNINPEATGSGTGQAETGGQPVSAFW
ncbi:MAG TPA: hypothetical protein V6D50_01775 [Chroococcales cyanobacterium]|jgi:cytoskeletal protein RodZ